MSELTDSNLRQTNLKQSFDNDSVSNKTARLTINLVTNILMCITVFVCLSYACAGNELNEYHFHIILCVLGYQFFMSQGILLLSKYNSWSMYLHRNVKRQLHVGFQIIGIIFVIIGSSLIISEKYDHFETAHGTLGICALTISILSGFNGITAQYVHKLHKSFRYYIKLFHYLSGVLTIFLSAACLSTAFDGLAFKFWAKSDVCIGLLIFITWVFTLLVLLDFWLSTARRIDDAVRNK